MTRLAKKSCLLPLCFVASLAAILTVFYKYHGHTFDWHVESTESRYSLTMEEAVEPIPPKVPLYRTDNYSTSDWQNLDSTLVAKVKSAKNLYSETLEQLIQLVSPKDPNCRPSNSTSDPFSQLDQATLTSLAKLLLSYRQQHIRWRKFLLEGNFEKIRTLTWYCDSGCGGIGDRLRSIGFSLMLAMISNRLLLIQWRQPFEVQRQKNIFEPSAIDWNLDQALADKLQKLSTASVTMMMTWSSTSQRANFIENFIISSEHHHVRIKTNLVFNAFVDLHQVLTTKVLENERYQILMKLAGGKPPTLLDSIHGVFVRYLFKFSPPTLGKAEQIIREMNMSDVKKYVVANIRSGFLGTINEGDYYATHSQQWEVVLDHAVNKSKQLGINGPVVLSCDSENVKSWAQEHYNRKVISIPRKPVHVDKMESDAVDKVNAEIDTAAEIVIMSRATFLFRTFTNGFTNVAVHMCPFVMPLSHFSM